MKCTVRRMNRNVRYRVLTIMGEKYILDMGGVSLWKLLFPFFYWILPNRIYKLESNELAEKPTAPTIQRKTRSSQVLWPLLASIFATSLSPLVNYFEISLPTHVNVLIVSIIIFLMMLLIGLLSQMFKEKVYQIVDLGQLTKGWLWIFPVQIKAVLLLIFMYVGCLGLGVLAVLSYIEDGNWFILLCSIPLLFVGVVLPGLLTIVEGDTRVKIVGGQKERVSPKSDIHNG